MLIFSNEWFAWFMSTYSILIGGIPVALTFILQLIAIYHPGVPTNKVIDLIAKYWRGK